MSRRFQRHQPGRFSLPWVPVLISSAVRSRRQSPQILFVRELMSFVTSSISFRFCPVYLVVGVAVPPLAEGQPRFTQAAAAAKPPPNMIITAIPPHVFDWVRNAPPIAKRSAITVKMPATASR